MNISVHFNYCSWSSLDDCFWKVSLVQNGSIDEKSRKLRCFLFFYFFLIFFIFILVMLDSTISWFKVCVVQSICANTIITLYLIFFLKPSWLLCNSASNCINILFYEYTQKNVNPLFMMLWTMGFFRFINENWGFRTWTLNLNSIYLSRTFVWSNKLHNVSERINWISNHIFFNWIEEIEDFFFFFFGWGSWRKCSSHVGLLL